jgi:hypothetical protein
MDIGEALRSEHSKSQTMRIVRFIGDDPLKFKELMTIFFGAEYRMTQRAAWPVSNSVKNHPKLIEPYLNKCVDLLTRKDVHNAVKRNVVRLLQYVEIPKNVAGKVYSHCIDLIDDINEPVAVRAFAITVATKIAKSEASLIGELQLVVKKHLPHTTIAFRKRSREILSLESTV